MKKYRHPRHGLESSDHYQAQQQKQADMNWIAYWLPFLAPLLTFGVGFGDAWAYGLILLLAFIAMPILDQIVGDDLVNPKQAQSSPARQAWAYDLPLYAFAPLQLALLLWACYGVSHAHFDFGGWLGFLILIGVVNGGLSINTAHELSHRKKEWEILLAKLLWFRVGYMHFQIEHVQGHHARMGTPKDHASARLGESVYAFYARCIKGSYHSAWQIEKRRLKSLGLSRWSWRNQMLWNLLLPLVFTVALGYWGWQASLFYLMQSALAILTLETINYIEHYGLVRHKLASGRYENVGLQHSWNSSRRLTNTFLFKLQRHSDHHVNASRPYPLLRAFPESPQLPTGYGGMFLLALCPPLWRRVMDPRALAWQQAEAISTGSDLSQPTLDTIGLNSGL